MRIFRVLANVAFGALLAWLQFAALASPELVLAQENAAEVPASKTPTERAEQRRTLTGDWSDTKLEEREDVGSTTLAEPASDDQEDLGDRRSEDFEGEELAGDSVSETKALPSGPAKTAVTPQEVSLPNAEGSIEGMGESFTPNLSSGTGTYKVPIALPEGRSGVQPSLELAYSTAGGNGVVGFGWSLSVPFIQRQTDRGLPRYIDAPRWHEEEDTFVYNGGQELVPVDSAAATSVDEAPVPGELAGWQQYRARIEGNFTRFFRSPDSQRWVVQRKDGTRFDLGSFHEAVAPSGQSLQMDPEGSGRVFAWHLTRMSDPHGATVYYAYEQDAGQVYLRDIFYDSPRACEAVGVGSRRDCSEVLDNYGRRVHFVYDRRPDATSSYVSTWRVETRWRLRRLEVTGHMGNEGQRFLVRRYHFGYVPGSYHSLLAQIQVEGRPRVYDPSLGIYVGVENVPEGSLSDEIIGQTLPPMRFGYTGVEHPTSNLAEGFGGIDGTVHESPWSPPHSLDEGRSDLFDVNGDGLPDLLVTDPARFGGNVGVYFNGFFEGEATEGGAFDDPAEVGLPL